MRHIGSQSQRAVLNLEMLHALRDSLRDLNNLRVVSQHDPYVLRLKRHLREKIAELEREDREVRHAAA